MAGGRRTWSIVVVTSSLLGVAGWLCLAGELDRTGVVARSPKLGSSSALADHPPWGSSGVPLVRGPAGSPNGGDEAATLGSELESASALRHGHGVRESPPEAGESRMTLEWRQMARDERIEEGRLAFERSIEQAERTRSLVELRSAASSLSVLKSDLWATAEGRKLYGRMEKRYGELEQRLE